MHLERGDNVAVVSDAGMPGVSDPGYRLVALAIRHHIRVVPIPGRIRLTLGPGCQRPAHRLFPLWRLSARQVRRQAHRAGGGPQFSPNANLLRGAASHCGVRSRCSETLGPERHLVMAREVTKLHEEFLRGRAEDVLAQLEKREDIRGEITLLIGKAEEMAHGRFPAPPSPSASRNLWARKSWKKRRR